MRSGEILLTARHLFLNTNSTNVSVSVSLVRDISSHFHGFIYSYTALLIAVRVSVFTSSVVSRGSTREQPVTTSVLFMYIHKVVVIITRF